LTGARPGSVRLERVPFDHPDAVALRDAMVAEVNGVYGGQRDRGSSGLPTGIDPATVLLTLVGYAGERPVAHALLRRLGDEVEIKRMFVALEGSHQGVGARRLVLHTGDRQTAAVRTYQRHGFTPIPVYEPYVGMPASLCFEKTL
jgi:GNAT superfamily N-acetyltransferase